MPLTPDQKKKLDTLITADFLLNNRALVTQVIQAFANQMVLAGFTGANGYNFYLKGGNALSMLRNAALTGDYDFQLKPPAATFAHWEQAFPVLDQRIIAMLIATVTNFQNTQFNLTSFTPNSIEAFARTAAIQGFDRPANGTMAQGILKIGFPYSKYDYRDVFSRATGGRIVFDPQDRNNFQIIVFPHPLPNLQLYIYANYTITGFILYRVVCSFTYMIGGESVNLKSEMIDVSVPRAGSAELYMSQEGVITYFRPAHGFPFNMPGLGYHFFENINLLQECELGISGSPHKQRARRDRLIYCINTLITANGVNRGVRNVCDLLCLNVMEEELGAVNPVCGYLGALVFNIDSYNVYDLPTIMQVRITIETQLRLSLVSMGVEQRFHIPKNLWMMPVEFKIKFRAPGTLLGAKHMVAQHMRGIHDMVLNTNWQFISPVTVAHTQDESKYKLPFDYIVVEVLHSEFQKTFNCSREPLLTHAHRVFSVNANAFAFKLSGTGVPGAIVVIIQATPQHQNQLSVNLGRNTHLTLFLERTILESQRYVLASEYQFKGE